MLPRGHVLFCTIPSPGIPVPSLYWGYLEGICLTFIFLMPIFISLPHHEVCSKCLLIEWLSINTLSHSSLMNRQLTTSKSLCWFTSSWTKSWLTLLCDFRKDTFPLWILSRSPIIWRVWIWWKKRNLPSFPFSDPGSVTLSFSLNLRYSFAYSLQVIHETILHPPAQAQHQAGFPQSPTEHLLIKYSASQGSRVLPPASRVRTPK